MQVGAARPQGGRHRLDTLNQTQKTDSDNVPSCFSKGGDADRGPRTRLLYLGTPARMLLVLRQ